MQETAILLVEGKQAGTASLAFALEKAGYQFRAVNTGSSAFQWIEEHGIPNLVIFDSSAMRSSGTRTCRRLRRIVNDSPIIHCRAAGVPEDGQAEADIYLEHPFTARKLLNRVRALLPADAKKEEIIRCGHLTIYCSKRSVEVGSRGEQRLTPKLLQLLVEFIRHPEVVIDRRQLMQNVWKTDYIGDTRTLDVHIRWVRECIEEDPAKPKLLRTVRGKGYIFRPSLLIPDDEVVES
ncbi:MAG: response regulator transcription factor [Ardenticatenaceae bacterium]|nr:response regulator transcription factor [Ardenticatenaceae bacterium]MCB8991027.1 response regulator transcription factor [Ardenticatenaceae bacterium]